MYKLFPSHEKYLYLIFVIVDIRLILEDNYINILISL